MCLPSKLLSHLIHSTAHGLRALIAFLVQTLTDSYLRRLTYSQLPPESPTRGSLGPLQPYEMADPQDLVRHATAWAGGPAELNKIMADTSTLSESHHSLVAEAARALLLEASSGGHLNKYQCALCNVYAARGRIMHEREQAIGGIQHASNHLETLRETSKPFAALGIVEHPQMEALAAMIEELKR
jgi:hypothetical protein